MVRTEAEPVTSAELIYAGVRTMIAAAHADGEISSVERAVIDRHVAESQDLAPLQLEQIQRDIVRPASPADLAALAPALEDRATLYRLAAAVVLADQTVAAGERAWLDQLAVAFAFDAQAKAMLESELFA